tara:strand:+ start:1941 stop:2312 length:372 start_codon:yes stop_codon:yes gene_type:complete
MNEYAPDNTLIQTHHTLNACASCWQQAGFTLPADVDIETIQVLSSHISVLLQIHLKREDGDFLPDSTELTAVSGITIGEHIAFLNKHGLIRVMRIRDGICVALTEEGNELSIRVLQSPNRNLH